MAQPITLAEAALKVARIAAATTDPTTAKQLLELVDELLTEAGLPPEPLGPSLCD
jgi:hypothetical protein